LIQSVTLLPRLLIALYLFSPCLPYYWHPTPKSHYASYQLPERTELSPDPKHQKREAYGDEPIQPYPARYLRALVSGRKVSKRRTEERRDECSWKEDQSDGRDQSHVRSVAVIEPIVLLLKYRIHLGL
jgi:hypothetical protein